MKYNIVFAITNANELWMANTNFTSTTGGQKLFHNLYAKTCDCYSKMATLSTVAKWFWIISKSVVGIRNFCYTHQPATMMVCIVYPFPRDPSLQTNIKQMKLTIRLKSIFWCVCDYHHKFNSVCWYFCFISVSNLITF